jgi:hypothetical protein
MPRLKFSGRMVDLFPPSDPRSPWMYRLAVLRDDVAHDATQLSMKDDDGPTEAWRCVFAIRHLAIVIEEARGIYDGEIEPWLPTAGIPEEGKTEIRAWKKVIDDACAIIRPFRNSFGGHVNPKNVIDHREIQKGHFARMMDALGGNRVSGTIGLAGKKHRRRTQFHRITGECFMFLWPEILEPVDGKDPTPEEINARYVAKHGEFHHALKACLPKIVNTADALLHHFWASLGIAPEVSGRDSERPRRKKG